jgi:hypothetical protein
VLLDLLPNQVTQVTNPNVREALAVHATVDDELLENKALKTTNTKLPFVPDSRRQQRNAIRAPTDQLAKTPMPIDPN